MREQAPKELVELLEQLGLATADRVGRMARRVRQLAGNLPHFASVWVDALAQARVLTPLQAAEINAGRGESLRVGPFVLCRRLSWPQYVDSYRATRLDGGPIVRLAVVEDAGKQGDEIFRKLKTLAAACGELSSEHLTQISEVGRAGRRIWAASPWTEGRSAAEWIAHNGRLPPEAVLQVAREMLVGLGSLEQAARSHGDVCAASVLFSQGGDLLLLEPGVRGILRSEEGYAHADLLPEAYDCLAPERVSDGTPPTVSGDVFSCGCLWWHMLCGRPPLGGGTSLAKLRSAQAARVGDLRRFAADVPAQLAAAISACLKREPKQRPESFARLAAMLGSPTRCGRTALVRCVLGGRRPATRWQTSVGAIRRSRTSPLWPAAIAVSLLVVAAVAWPLWRARLADKAERRQPAPAELVAAEPSRPAVPYRAGRQMDGSVVPAHFETEEPLSGKPAPRVLACGGPLTVESLSLQRGQCVRGQADQRPLLLVPRGGLVVDAEEVRFENIDFRYAHAAEVDGPPPAIVELRASRAEFQGCSFGSNQGIAAVADAVRWTHPADTDDGAAALPSGCLRFGDCVLHRVSAGVDCRTLGARAVEFDNTLHLGTGPLIRLDHCPKVDEPVVLSLSRLTLRGGGPLLECCYGQIEQRPGEISIRSAGCALVPGRGAALLLYRGAQPPEKLLDFLEWTGQGSLVSPQTPIAVWQDAHGRVQVLDDATVSIDGLVRSEVDFAGTAGEGPAASRIIRWQVPLRSTDPPGIDPARLPISSHQQ